MCVGMLCRRESASEMSELSSYLYFPVPQYWRELEKQVSCEIMFKIIIKVENTMADPFLLSETYNQTSVIFRPVYILYEAQDNITNGGLYTIYQNNTITSS